MARSTPPVDAKIGKKIDFLAAEIGDALKPHGFTRKARRFWREVGEGDNRCFLALDIQADTWNAGSSGKFCINMGVQLPALGRLLAEMPTQAWLLPYVELPHSEVSCVRARLQDALPAERESWWPDEMAHDRDVWFTIGGNTDLDVLADALRRTANDYILPWLERNGGLEGVFAGRGGAMGELLGHRLIAGVLLGRGAEVAALFAEHGSRRLSGPAHREMKDWLAARGVDVAGAEYTPAPPNPAMTRRNDALREARLTAQAAEKALAESDAPLLERLPRMLDAVIEAGRASIGSTEDSPVAKVLKEADARTQRHAILTILHKLVQAPTSLPSRTANIWGDVSYVHDHRWGKLLVALLKDQPCDEGFARDLLSALHALAGRHHRPGVVCIGYPFPFARIVGYLYHHARPWSEALKPQVGALLEEIRRQALGEFDDGARLVRDMATRPDASEVTRMLAAEDDTATRQRISDYPEQSFEKADREAIGMLRDWLRRDAGGEEALDIEQDDWGRQLTAALQDFGGDRTALMAMIAFIAKDVPTRPTRTFNKRLGDFLPLLDAGTDQEANASWLDSLLRGYARSDLTHEWATTGPRPGVGAFLGETSGSILLGLIHLARLWDAARFAPALAVVAEAGFTVVPGIRMRSQKAGTAAVEALGASAEGRLLLAEMRRHAKKPAICKAMDAVLDG